MSAPSENIILSYHGIKQLKKRVGIPKRGAKRHIEKVVSQGTRDYQCNKSMYRKWSDWARNHYRSDLFYFYDDYVYGFKKEDDKLVLITVLYLPCCGAWTN